MASNHATTVSEADKDGWAKHSERDETDDELDGDDGEGWETCSDASSAGEAPIREEIADVDGGDGGDGGGGGGAGGHAFVCDRRHRLRAGGALLRGVRLDGAGFGQRLHLQLRHAR